MFVDDLIVLGAVKLDSGLGNVLHIIDEILRTNDYGSR